MATAKVKIWREHETVKDLIRNNSQLRDLEDDRIRRTYDEITAQFLVDFGVEGKFIIKEYFTRQGRRTVKISADDARTGAILKARPGWLNKFIK